MAARQQNENVIAGEDKGHQDAVGFDFEAWIGGASRPERQVTIYAANAVQAEILRLEEERDALIEAYEPAKGDERWGDAPDEGPDTADVDARITAAQQRLAATGVVFTVQSIDSDEEDAIFKQHAMPKDADDEIRSKVSNARLMAKMVQQITGPQKFTPTQLAKLRKAIGEPEFMKLWRACVDTNSEVSASTPTWRGNSGSSRS